MPRKHAMSAGSTQSDSLPPQKRVHQSSLSDDMVTTPTYGRWMADDNFFFSDNIKFIEGEHAMQAVQKSLSKGHNKIIRRISSNILAEWPLSGINPVENEAIFVTSWAFYEYAFKGRLQEYLNKAKDRNDTRHKKCVECLDELLKSDCMDAVQAQIFDLFKETTVLKKNEKVVQCLDKANKIRKDIFNALKFGKFCQKNAVWIGIERSSMESIPQDQLIIETKSSLMSTTQQPDAYFLEDTEFHRICAPLKNTETHACIFWTKLSPTDKDPTWDKVFGGAVYNPEAWKQEIFNPLTNKVQNDMLALFETIRQNTPVERGVFSTGYMTKSLGIQSNRGNLYNPEIKVPELKSKNPRAATIEKVQKQENLRVEMKYLTPYIQARDFEFLRGFLPKFANSQIKTAKDAGLLNPYGFPQTAAFGTCAYSAGAHLDQDESVSTGWVVQRNKLINRFESNFVYASHRLVLESKENMYWFWEADKEEHGTTMNSTTLGTQSQMAEENSQYTRVTVLPRKIVLDARREQRKNKF